ncbi:MAG TPA: hypothetical protein VI756_00060 [Blastocatellia bacterium]
MKTAIALCLLCLVLPVPRVAVVAAHNAEQWGKYVPPQGRKQILKKATRVVSSTFSSGEASVTWVTDDVASALVSSMIDKERLSLADADKRYGELRGDHYTFLATVWFVMVGREPIGMHHHSSADIANPIKSDTLFLQRAEDNKVFSRGTAAQTDFDASEGVREAVSRYMLTFPKTGDNGQPLINSMTNTVELQFDLAGKTSKAKFVLHDIANRPDSL